MAIPEDIILDIKDRNDIESVISPYVTLKRAGKNLKGLCPFHNEKTPSFVVYPENGSFYCFGCGVGGDIFTFTKLIENLDYDFDNRLLYDEENFATRRMGCQQKCLQGKSCHYCIDQFKFVETTLKKYLEYKNEN
jgi:DNA primase